MEVSADHIHEHLRICEISLTERQRGRAAIGQPAVCERIVDSIAIEDAVSHKAALRSRDVCVCVASDGAIVQSAHIGAMAEVAIHGAVILSAVVRSARAKIARNCAVVQSAVVRAATEVPSGKIAPKPAIRKRATGNSASGLSLVAQDSTIAQHAIGGSATAIFSSLNIAADNATVRVTTKKPAASYMVVRIPTDGAVIQCPSEGAAATVGSRVGQDRAAVERAIVGSAAGVAGVVGHERAMIQRVAVGPAPV